MEGSADGSPQAWMPCGCGAMALGNRQPPARTGWCLLVVVPVVLVAATWLCVFFIPGFGLKDQLGKCWVRGGGKGMAELGKGLETSAQSDTHHFCSRFIGRI